MIEGVEIKQLTRHVDERGYVMEILRNDEKELLPKFGQVYITIGYPNVVKGWHYHELQDDNFCVVKGMAKVALYDRREDSPTKGNVLELFIGEKNPMVVHIPVGVVHGFKAVGNEPAYLLNVITEAYNREKPDEKRIPYDTDEIPYKWVKDING